ncbi:hypothetical protein AMECASPLE_030422 [Ameca splendens]|uniref:Uncharacterized protein n=1 Tax=Ameca splendens TaxID=208324 RepID=A0ABV1A1G5_9TELE
MTLTGCLLNFEEFQRDFQHFQQQVALHLCQQMEEEEENKYLSGVFWFHHGGTAAASSRWDRISPAGGAFCYLAGILDGFPHRV